MTLKVDSLSFSYGRRLVLDELSLEFAGGQLVGLLGPNGSGKSTLVTCLAQLRKHNGRVSYRGAHGKALLEQLGYMPQGLPGDASLTALESVLAASRRGMSWHTGRADVERAWHVLRDLGVGHLADRLLGHLSGGQRQMVALAQTLVRDPNLMLLDEPTSALDLHHQVSVLSRVRQICHADDKKLAVVALHDLNLAARFCDRIAVLSGGRLIAQGTPHEVLVPDVLHETYGVRTRIVPDGDYVMVAPETD
ncbi:ABC transporter ATP-binding protein [Dermabacteraceae bacterium P7054]